ncbi:hypothetical protein AAC387_Pa06g0895 [Persea americana]
MSSSSSANPDPLELLQLLVIVNLIGELAGFAVEATVLLNILSTRPVSGASMNPVRSSAPAIVFNPYEGIWVYMVGPICGTVMGAWAYNLIRYTDKPACMRSFRVPLS